MWVKGGLILRYATLQIDVATDAIQHDQIRSMYDEQLRGNSSGHRIPGGGGATAAALQGGGQLGPPHCQRNSYDSLTNGEEDEVGGHQGAVYAQNLDLVSQQFDSDGLTAEVVGPTVSEGLDRNQVWPHVKSKGCEEPLEFFTIFLGRHQRCFRRLTLA